MIAAVAGFDPQLNGTEFLKAVDSLEGFLNLVKIFGMNKRRQRMVLFHMSGREFFDRQNFLSVAGQFQHILQDVILKNQRVGKP